MGEQFSVPYFACPSLLSYATTEYHRWQAFMSDRIFLTFESYYLTQLFTSMGEGLEACLHRNRNNGLWSVVSIRLR